MVVDCSRVVGCYIEASNLAGTRGDYLFILRIDSCDRGIKSSTDGRSLGAVYFASPNTLLEDIPLSPPELRTLERILGTAL